MRTEIKLLDQVKVAAPCPMDWNEMVGDDRTRFCQNCGLNVYNLSDMSRKEAEDLLIKQEGRLCVRYFQRYDGTILTDNCPVGVRKLRNAALRRYATVASMVTVFAGSVFALFGRRASETTICADPPYISVTNVEPVTGSLPTPIMGDVAPIVKPPARATVGFISVPERVGKVTVGEMAPPPPPVPEKPDTEAEIDSIRLSEPKEPTTQRQEVQTESATPSEAVAPPIEKPEETIEKP